MTITGSSPMRASGHHYAGPHDEHLCLGTSNDIVATVKSRVGSGARCTSHMSADKLAL